MATETEGLEQELRELSRLKRCRTIKECPDPQWRLIEDLAMEHKGETYVRKVWVAVCGGAVEYVEGITPEGERVYQVERFELRPESWARKRIIAPPCSQIVSDRYGIKEEALKRVDFHKESITPFWYKVKKG